MPKQSKKRDYSSEEVSDVEDDTQTVATVGTVQTLETLETLQTLDTTATNLTANGRPRKPRVTPTMELLIEEINELVRYIDDEVHRRREAKEGDIRFLKATNKKIKEMRLTAQRVEKRWPKPRRRRQGVSELQRPRPITKEMAEFAGWGSDEEKSRVDITRNICQYIKEKDQQNPEFRRQIIPDKRLQNLLHYDPKTDPPLTYPRIQKYITQHLQ